MNAVKRATSEAFVTGNETLERSIASLREKMDRDHAALAANQAALSERVHLNDATLIDRINSVYHSLRDKIDESHATLSANLTATREKLETADKELLHKIDAVDLKLSHKIDALTAAFAELRSFHKTVVWVCGGIVTTVTVSLSVGKALGWI